MSVPTPGQWPVEPVAVTVARIESRLAGMEARLEARLDRALSDVDDHEARIRTLESEIAQRDHDHEVRLRRLERALWMSAGAAAAVGGGIGATLSAVLQIGH